MGKVRTHGRRVLVVGLVVFSCTRPRCDRADPKDASVSSTATPGGSPAGNYKVQCSGWFPDWLWVAERAPTSGRSFQLSQGYPLGVPRVVEDPPGSIKIAGYDPYAPATTPTDAPWLAFHFDVPAEREQYLDALETYFLEGNTGHPNIEDDFVAQNNTVRSWFHVPMMTTKPHARREPLHGLTKERAMRSNQHTWIKNSDGDGLRAFAIGAYNWLGGYTIGQVFSDPNPQNAKPAAAKFIEGAFVFKLLFAEYAPGSIQGDNPLDGSPEWQVQDVDDPISAGSLPVRLIQVDVAVRDPRATKTGWVFATFVYDKTVVAPTPWGKLRAVGLQWGDDASATAPPVAESWINPAVPTVYHREDNLPFGRDGRLNGPVDNPVSSCISCHGTAQIVTGVTSSDAARGASLVPPTSCSPAQAQFWFHDVAAGAPFGVMDGGGLGCTPAMAQPGSPPLYGLDYSLQMADALESSLAFHNPNPCAGQAESLRDVMIVDAPAGDRAAASALRDQMRAANLRDLNSERLKKLPNVLVRRQKVPARLEVSAKVAEPQGDDHHQR